MPGTERWKNEKGEEGSVVSRLETMDSRGKETYKTPDFNETVLATLTAPGLVRLLSMIDRGVNGLCNQAKFEESNREAEYERSSSADRRFTWLGV